MTVNSESIRPAFYFCGLGNNDVQHQKQRHNFGAMVIEFLQKRLQFSLRDSKFCYIYEGEIENVPVSLLVAKSSMNNTGEILFKQFSQSNFEISNLCVLHDDMETELGRVKYKFGQGANGHNGLRSIDRSMSNNYHRLRLGIGRPPEHIPVSKFVLSDFLQTEMTRVHNIFELVYDILPYLVTGDITEVQNRCKNVS